MLSTPTATAAVLVEWSTPQRHTAMVVKGREALPRLPSPFLKKKLLRAAPD